MKKFQGMFSFLLAAVLITGVATIGGGCFSSSADTDLTKEAIEAELSCKHHLKFDEKGEFKVLICSDLHTDWDKSHKYVKALVDKYEPDLVWFNGDNAYVNTEKELREWIDRNMGYLEEKKIPWAQVFGNHDVEFAKALTKDIIMDIYMSYPYNVSKKGPKLSKNSGVGNFVLPVYSSRDDKKLAYAIWGIDSNMYLEDNYKGMASDACLKNPINGGYSWDYIKSDQIAWYKNTSEEIEKYAGKQIPGVMLFHIPLPEMNYLPKNKEQTGYVGHPTVNEAVNCSEVNSGMFAAILQRGDIKGLFHGHDHNNDYTGTYLGVRMSYVPTMGHVGYRNEEVMGARLVVLKEDGDFDTSILNLKNEGIYDDALDVHYPKPIEGIETSATTLPVPAQLKKDNMLFNFDEDGYEPEMIEDLVRIGDSQGGTYYTGVYNCNIIDKVDERELSQLEITGNGRNGKGLQIIKPNGTGLANFDLELFMPGDKTVTYNGEKYLRIWVDFTKVDFRAGAFGVITDKGVRYSGGDNCGAEFLPLYVLPETDGEWNGIDPNSGKWTVYMQGGNGCWGSGSVCGLYGFKGWMAVRVEDFMGWEGPATNYHPEAQMAQLKSGEKIKGLYFYYDMLDKRVKDTPFVFDEIEFVDDYSVFEAQ